MVTVTAVKNALDPFNNVTCQMLSGLSVENYIAAMLPTIPDDYDLVLSIDGRQVDRYSYPILSDNQSLALVVVPQGGGAGGNNTGKMIAKIIGLIVIAVVSYGVGAAVAGSAWAASTAASVGMGVTAAGIGAGVGAGVAIAGGIILNAVLPITSATQQNTQSSPTYSWSVVGNAVLEGAALPTLFGTMRVVPPRLAMFVSMNGQDQTVYLLFAVSGHKIDSITDIQINDTGDIATNFPEVGIDIHLGLNDDVFMPGFDNTEVIVSADVGLPGNRLTDTWRTITTEGNAVTALGFGFVMYAGCYVAESDGSLSPNGVRLKIEYKLHGASTWTQYMQANTETITIVTPRWSAGYYQS